ncbi:cupin-like domain-containing protein [Bowmanella denitrificans]|uniref:Cupin-like domain-containing protein n=1 Tax=Bowmanella denitrificans TaxID=366582 RepID=A0ABN0XN55_9ALTE
MHVDYAPVPVINNLPPGQLPADLSGFSQPVVFKGLVSHWKLVVLGRQSSEEAVAYLKSFYNGNPAFVYQGEPGLDGRYGYNDDFTRLNYETSRLALDEVLDRLLACRQTANPPSYYIASNVIDYNFPGLSADNHLDIPVRPSPQACEPPVPSLWIGNRSVARCHYDASDNIACVVLGRRRFTLFPPDQIANLYPGPLTPTPGGQAITSVDIHQPDLGRFPRFAEAIKVGLSVELEPGDAIYIPSMWWHQVEGLDSVNILINYWWSDAAKFMGSAMNVLQHAMLSLRDKPAHEKAAWKQVFDYYVFGDSQLPRAHLPEQAWGDLGPMTELSSRQLRARLINKLNR